MPGTTPSQTVGPFFSIGLPWPDGPFVVEAGTEGAVTLRGRVFDGAGDPIPDAVVETWQADPQGRFDHPDDPRGAVPGFRGFGRTGTTPAGEWEIVTLKPGPVPGPDGTTQAPHVDVSVFARGLLNRVVTRIYFADEPEANAADPVLAGLDEAQRATLLAEPDGRSGEATAGGEASGRDREGSARGSGAYRFDVHLQGPRETTFFAV